MLLGAALGQFECKLQDPVDAGARHDGFLNHHLAIGAGKHAAADGRILAFGVLAHDEKVDVAGLPAGQRRLHAGHQAHGTQVDVLVEFPAKLDQ